MGSATPPVVVAVRAALARPQHPGPPLNPVIQLVLLSAPCPLCCLPDGAVAEANLTRRQAGKRLASPIVRYGCPSAILG